MHARTGAALKRAHLGRRTCGRGARKILWILTRRKPKPWRGVLPDKISVIGIEATQEAVKPALANCGGAPVRSGLAPRGLGWAVVRLLRPMPCTSRQSRPPESRLRRTRFRAGRSRNGPHVADKPKAGGWFVVDAPIRDADEDAFGHDDVADNLHRMVTEPTTHRRMVGLFGQFGVGKSTVIELLRAKLVGHKDLTLIRMSAERHEPVGFHRAAVYAFAEALVEAGEVSAKEADEVLEPLRSAQSTSISDITLSPLGRLATALQTALQLDSRKFWRILVFAVLGAALLLGLGAVFIPTDIWTKIGGFAIPIVTACAFFSPFIWLANTANFGAVNLSGLVAPGNKSSQRAKVEAADEQERAFAELVAKSTHRLIVAVDDIDRLSRDQILAALNAIRSLQLTCSRARQPIFIIAIDEQIVRSAIESNEAKTTPDAQEFLNRLFTLRQEVPVHESFDLRDYARTSLTERASLLNEKLGGHVEDVLLMLIHDDVSDPRHVVRLINAFSSDYRLAAAREAREGARSIRAGLVTDHLDILARIVVIKTDYPVFFRSALSDHGLISVASGASSLELTDDEYQFLVNEGFDPQKPEHASLFRYLARTAGWVQDGVDLTPFLHLGQDRFSLMLGNAQAREIRSALANNQPASLARLGNEAQAGGDAATETFQELTVTVLRQLGSAEQSNGVAATLAAVKSCEPLQTSAVARTVAPLIDKHSLWLTDVVGATKLLESAGTDAAHSLATAVLNSDADESDTAIWQSRSLLEGIVGEDYYAAWIERRVAATITWKQWRAWPINVLDEQSASLMLARAVALAARGNEDDLAEEDDFHRAEEIASLIITGPRADDEEALRKAVAQPADTYGSAIGLLAAEKFALTKKQLSDLSYTRVSTSIAAVGEEVEPLDAVMDGVAKLAVRAAKEVPGWSGKKGAERVWSAGVLAGHVAAWIETGIFPASRGVPILEALVHGGVPQQVPLMTTLFAAWVDAPDDVDVDDISHSDTVSNVVGLAPHFDSTTQEALVAAWIATLASESTLANGAGLTPAMLASGNPPIWADRALSTLMMWFDTSYDFTGIQTDAAAAVMATGQVSKPIEETLLARLTNVANSGSVYRQRSYTTTARLQWSRSILPAVADAVAPFLRHLEKADFWALVDLLQMYEQSNPQFIARIDAQVENDDDLTAARSRVDALADKLTLENAVTLVLGTTSAAAMEVVAARWADPAERVTAATGSGWLIRASRNTSEESKRLFAAAMAKADSIHYAATVDVLLDETLDLGNGAHVEVWAFVTLPMTPETRGKLLSKILPLLTESQREAIAAASSLHATATDPAFDDLAADGVREALVYWIVSQPDASVASALARAVHHSKRSRAEALAARRARPKIAERAVAYDAAMKVLRG